jgi:phenylalanyl-tRNA synthetase beta chain
MNISYNWLKNYINTDKTPAEVAEILTSLGLEVGSVEEVETVKGGLKGLVVGEVLTRAKHPNADKLSVTTVNIGTGDPIPVVCGAPNVAAGQKVIVATVGTILYSGNEPFTIKKSKIRGEESEGMICAEDEIGLGTSHDGIMVLDGNAVVGTPAAQYFNIESDVILEVDLTPNRIDSASHIGVARDLAASLQQNNPKIKTNRPSVEGFKTHTNNFPVKVVVENTEACPRYSGVTISGITVAESPDWLKNRLRSIGLSPINNVVDITNFVLHECGQPLHAFDGDKITDNQIVVKTLPAATRFVTLDGKERELHNQDLMICNTREGMCMAGVFGGLESGVTNTTKKIFLESACFNPVYIRKTSRRHGLFTDASFRFERGTDPNITVYALKRAAMLICEVAGGEVSSPVVDVYPTPVADFDVYVAWKNIHRLIGKTLGHDVIKNILGALEIRILKETADGLQVAVPPYRVDVQRESDVIEEILRIYGFNNVETSLKVNSTIVYSPKPDGHQLKNAVANLLTGNGFQEIMCNSLTRAAYCDGLSDFPRSAVVELANPLSSDLNGMRPTLLFGGLETIVHNRNRQHPDLKLFEFGNCYSFRTGQKDDLKNYQEDHRLSLFLTGMTTQANWNSPARKVSYFDLKNHCENILLRLGIAQEKWQVKAVVGDVLAEGLAYTAQNSKLLTLGMVHGKLLKQFDLDEPVFFAEFHWDALLKVASRQTILFKELSKFPEVRRDLALLLDQSVQFGTIQDLAFKTEKKLLKSVSLFDVYQGEQLGADKKSYAVSFILEDPTRTLNDQQIDKIMQNLTQVFEKELGAKLR